MLRATSTIIINRKQFITVCTDSVRMKHKNWPQSLDDSSGPSPSHNSHNNNNVARNLPAKAVIEGPSSYFRLLGIDQAGGLRHEQFAALLMSATDNR